MFVFNWVDLVLVFVFFAIVRDGQKSDFITEMLKVVGILLATFVTLHYYSKLSVLLQGKVFVPQDYRDLFAYILLIGLMLCIVTMVRGGWLILLGVEVSKFSEKWFKLLASVIRAYLMVGLLFLAFFVSNNYFVANQARHCFLAKYTENISLDIYQGVFRFLVRFFPEEIINAEALVLTVENRKDAEAAVKKMRLKQN